MNSGNPLEALLRGLMMPGGGGGGDGSGGNGPPAMFTINADGAGSNGIPLSMLNAMGGAPNIVMSGPNGIVVGGPNQRTGSRTGNGGGPNSPTPSGTPTAAGAAAASAGSVYSGGMPPMMWIQREQQRMPLHFSATGSANLDSTRLREAGNEAFKAGSFNAAVGFYTQAIEIDPDSAINYSNRSFAWFKLKEYAKSAADAEAAVRLNDKFFKGFYRLGMAQMEMNEFQRAIENLRRAWALAPEPNKESIRVAMAKCESKLARAPATPLLMSPEDSSNATNTPAPGSIGSRSQWPASPFTPDTPFPLGAERVDLHALEQRVHEVAEGRARTAHYKDVHKAQGDIVECGERSAKIKLLMSVATTDTLASLGKDAEERQAALRRAVGLQDSNAYCEAKRSRDSTLDALWDTAEHVEAAITQLKTIAKEEQDFFSRFGPPVSPALSPTAVPATVEANVAAAGDAVATPLPASVHSPTSAPPPASPSPAASPPPAPSAEAGTDFKSLLRRRDEIDEAVCKAQKCVAATNIAAQVLARALRAEAEALQHVSPFLTEAAELNLRLEAHARQVAQTTTKELSDVRLQALDQVSAVVSRIRADQTAFKKTLREGEGLLVEEAKLEEQRLLRERQRIQLQAEVEWFKVRDEPQSRILSLQHQVGVLQQRIAQIHEKQKAVQSRIMELVDQDHPELAWKSTANGSRILRLVKGSGLWQNLSFSDFHILSTLSSTVNSKVYHAVRRGEQVAIKEISVDDEAARRRFEREVNIIAGCNHPNIIRIKGVFFDGPFAYILLPYYHRGSLRAQLGKLEPKSWVAVQDLFRQLASGVAYLHERGIVHADIKPSNVMIADDGRPVISDFGIAKDHGTLGIADMTLTTTVTTTNTGMTVAGTTQYMAPEQLQREPGSQRPRSTCMSDMWALGVTMLEIALHNAYFHDSSLGKPNLPMLMPGEKRIEVPTRLVGGDEKLAEAISSTLVVDPTERATAYDLLANPYFSSNSSSVASTQNSNALALSDQRIDAVRSYIHAMRRVHAQKVLVSVARTHMVESVRNIFQHIDNDDLLSPILVVFQGEAGIDEGALTTEMLNLFYDQFITVKKGLVCASDDDGAESTSPGSPPGSPTHAETVGGGGVGGSALYSTVPYLPAPDADGLDSDLFFLLGKVLLKSVIENRPLPIQLSTAVLKFLCGSAPSFADLEEYDATLSGSLKRLRLLSSADLEGAPLDFSHFSSAFLQAQKEGRYTTTTALSPESVGDYIDLRVQFDLVERRRAALEAMRRGFFCEPSLEHHLRLLSPSDLQLLLCGQMHISARVILDALDFQGFDSRSNTPKYLKEVLLEMSQNNLRRFLQLCTTTAAVPMSGTMKKIKVLRCGDVQRLPVGHGCVNQLDLPDYNDRQVIKEKLEVALAHANDGFHIV